MRILALTNLFPNAWQPGRAPFNRQQIHALAASHSVRVIAPIAWTDELANRGRIASPRMSSEGIEVDHPRYLFPPKMLRSSYGHCFLHSVKRSFDRALHEFHPDIVYATWAYPDGWAAGELGHRAGLPVALRVHGSDVTLIEKHPGRRRGTCQAIAHADAVIAPSEQLAKRVVELGAAPARTHVIYNGVDLAMFHPGSRPEARRRLGLPAEKPIVLFVGNLVSVKNVDLLIEACAKLVATKTSFVCRIIGQGSLASHLGDQIQKLGLPDSVKLLGAKPHAELPDWYRAANLVVLPSQSEGMPNVLLEAAACGTRFVASRVGGIPEIADESSGRLVSPGNVDELAEALRRELTESVELAPALRPARSFDDSAAELAAVLQQVVKAHKLASESTTGGGVILSMESK